MKKSCTARLRTSVALCALSVALTETVPAFAADTIEEIVVTSRRREELLQRIPLAVTSYSEGELTAKGITNLADIATFMPNVTVGSQTTGGTQNATFTIRGIGQDRTGINFDQGVGLYIDDMYYARSDSVLMSIVDPERVEVLRGPQGTLFGKNTIGGAVRYVTKKPGADFYGYVDGTYGSFQRTDVKATVNVPLAANLFAKATFGSFDNDGFIKEVAGSRHFGGDNTQIGRLALRALATDRITVDLTVDHTRTDTDGRAFIIAAVNPAATWPTALRTKTGQIYDARYVSPDPYTLYGGRDSFYKYDMTDASLVVNGDITDQMSVKFISTYLTGHIHSKGDYDGTPLPVFDSEFDRSLNSYSEELQFSGTFFDGRLNLVSGLYYMNESPSDVANTISAFDATFPATIRVTSLKQTTNSYAAYAQGTYKITDKLSTTIGLRYSRDEKDVVTRNFTTNLLASSSASWGNMSPRFGLEYQWTDDVMTYLSAARGFRSGGINTGLLARSPTGVSYTGVSQPLSPYAPEKVWTYEAGIRADLLNKRARLNVTGFYTDYSNLQLTSFNAVQNLTIIQNVGKATMKGVEIEALAAVTDQLRLQATLGYIDAAYDDLGTATGVSLKSSFVKTPRLSYSFGARYLVPLVNGGNVTANADWGWKAHQNTASTDSNAVTIPSYGILNLRLQYNAPGSKWSAALYATNLLDKTYYIGGVDFAAERSIGMKQLDVGRPQEVGFNVRYNF
jgi:iron complex outermembrane recepter protein